MDKDAYYRSFLIQIQGLGYEKEFKGMFNNLKHCLKLFSENKDLLFEKKQNYDFAYVQIMDYYGIDTTNIYNELDELWNKCVEYSEIYNCFPDKIPFKNKYIYEELDIKKYTRVTKILKLSNKIWDHTHPHIKLLNLKFLFDIYIKKCENLAKEKIKTLK